MDDLKSEIRNILSQHGDRDFYLGFLLGAEKDNVVKLEEGWMELPIETLLEMCILAYLSAAQKMINGEILPSENIKPTRVH